MRLRAKFLTFAVFLSVYALPAALHAQDAKQIVRQAVDAELAANRDDHSHWRYVKTEDGGTKFVVVETEDGAISRHLEENGRPASAATVAADDQFTEKFIHDPGMRQRQRQNGLHDDKSAVELLNLFPQAFDWKIESESPESVTLSFKPDPGFHPPDMESRVMGEMAGTLVVDKKQHRIQTMKGKLTEDINIGFGILGRLREGGTFNVERRQVAPGLWQITQTHVHIDGRALFFKTIGQQQDEVKFDFTQVPPGTTLEQAVELLKQPAK
jgi:Ni/Co efflux regulator RcnB